MELGGLAQVTNHFKSFQNHVQEFEDSGEG
jgi:hypothetical protein